MKKYLIIIALATAVGIWAVGVGSAADEPKMKPAVVTGEVVDLWCYLEAGARGAGHKDCAIACARAGQPIGIVDEKGHVYLALGAKDKSQSAKDLLVSKMAETVTVTGHIVKKGGIEAIYIDMVNELPKEMPKEIPKELPKLPK